MADYLHALPSGYRLEEYELVRVLGSGGFGITYLGYDHHLDKAVAVKEYLPNDLAVRTDNQSVLPKSTQDRADYEWGLERFLSEAQTLARFDHRHIIKIHRFFRAHGTGYIVMEYAEGETLSEVLQRKETLLGAIDWALWMDEGDRPQSVAEWRQVLAGDSGNRGEHATGPTHRPVIEFADDTAIPRTRGSWFSWTPLGMWVGVIVVLVGVINQNTVVFIAGALLGASARLLHWMVSKDFKKGKHAYSAEEYLEAMRLYRKAAQQGHVDAQYELGLMYASGTGVVQDYTEAVRWLRKAAEQGNAGAQFHLGEMYVNGDGVPKDHVQAYAWVSIAVVIDPDYFDKEDLNDIANSMTPEQIAKARDLSREYWKAYSYSNS